VHSGEELAAKLHRITDTLKAQKQAQDVMKQEKAQEDTLGVKKEIKEESE